jgi:hypothetical protein
MEQRCCTLKILVALYQNGQGLSRKAIRAMICILAGFVSFVLAAYRQTCPFASSGALWYNLTSFGRSFALWSGHPIPQ